MRRSLSTLLLILVASAAAHYAKAREAPEPLVGQQEATTATPEQPAVMYIFMKSSLANIYVGVKVAVDTSSSCDLVAGTYCTVTLRSGKHKVTAALLERRSASVDLDVLAGESYYLEVAPKFSHLELVAVPKEKALPTVAKASVVATEGFEAPVTYTSAERRARNTEANRESKAAVKAAENQPANPICKPWSNASWSHKCQAYPGDKRPKRDVAIVKVSSNLDAKSLDGKDLVICNIPRNGRLTVGDCNGAVESIELLPGKYTIEFTASRPYGAISFSSTGVKSFDLVAEAGKTYKFTGTYTALACTGAPFGQPGSRQCEGIWSVALK